LEEEGQGDHRQHLRSEGTDRGSDGEREDRYSHQVDGKQREALAQLPADKEISDYAQRYDSAYDEDDALFMGDPFQREDQQSEGQRVHQATDFVEAPAIDFHRVAGQVGDADHQGGDAERDIDGKQPVPRAERQDSRRDGRSGSDRDCHDKGVYPHSSPQKLFRIDDT